MTTIDFRIMQIKDNGASAQTFKFRCFRFVRGNTFLSLRY
jgi:hypothetical protein